MSKTVESEDVCSVIVNSDFEQEKIKRIPYHICC